MNIDIVGDSSHAFLAHVKAKRPGVIQALEKLVTVANRSEDLFTGDQIFTMTTEGTGFILTLNLHKYTTVWSGSVVVEWVYYPHSCPPSPPFPRTAAEVELWGTTLNVLGYNS